MKYITFFLITIFANSNFNFAQPVIQWQKNLGGTLFDIASSIQQTVDGGFIVGGKSTSNDFDVPGNYGSYDYWIVKLDNSGTVQWQKTFGGTNADNLSSIKQTIDGGYIAGGYSNSNDNNVTGNHGDFDYWIVKLDSTGSIQWQKSFGGSSSEKLSSIQQTTDAGYIAAGYTVSNDGDVSGSHGYYDYWIIKINTIGDIQWQKCLGGTSLDAANSIQQTSDEGYIVAGESSSNNGDVSGNYGSSDFWIVKLDSSGIIQWEKSFGGISNEYANSCQQTNDGGYIAAGSARSTNGNVTVNHGQGDCWIVKLDSAGTIQWQNSLGSTGNDALFSIQQTIDDGYIAAGSSDSNNYDVTGNHGGLDCWIVKLDSFGSIQWQKSLGGSNIDYANCIQQTNDAGFIAAGRSLSSDGDLTGNHGDYDAWVVKFAPVVNINEIQSPIIYFHVLPNPISSTALISFNISNTYNVNIEVRDIEGRLIKSFANKNYSIGKNEILWNVSNNSGGYVENGFYFITIASENYSETKKVVILSN